MTNETERAAFELTMKFRVAMRRKDNGKYENPCHQDRWEGWQARAKLDRMHTTGGDVVRDAEHAAMAALEGGE